ncbi:MAG: hypothetical protein U9R79_06560 [Armatimonadota bacterium]|nr:hypothetical protein [Armatimonadota bacterium]
MNSCPASFSALAALLAAGFAAGVAQVLLMRELLVVAYGNELSMGLLLACWLLAGAAGSTLAARRLRADEAHQGAARRMAMLCALPGPLLLIALSLVRAAPLLLVGIGSLDAATVPVLGRVLAWLATRPGEMLGLGQMLLVGAVVASGPAALDGAQFAVGCDLYCRARRRASAGPAYAADAVGHLIGGVLLATAVVVLLDPFTMALAVAVVNAVPAALLLTGSDGGRLRAALVVAGGALLVAMLASPATAWLQRRSLQWRWYNHELLANIETIFGNTAVVRQQRTGIYVYENGLYSGASPPLPGTIDELVHFTLLQHPQPRRVLLIGGGITGGLREVLKHRPDRVAYVELDEALLGVAQRWAAPGDRQALKHPAVQVIIGDGRRVIASTERSWDAVIIALPDPATAQLNRFYTREFYTTAEAALAEGGVVGWEVPGSRGYFSPALLRLHCSLLSTASIRFPHIARMPGESTVCVAGRGQALTTDWRELQRRMSEREVDAPWLEAMLPDRLDPSTLTAVNAVLADASDAPVNRDLRPIGYFLDQSWWLTQFQPASAALLERLSRVSAEELMLVVGLGLSMLLALSWLRPVAASFIPVAVACSGFVSMALEVSLLFAFQSLYGYVYSMVGVIIGAFMVGAAAGSLLAERGTGERPAIRTLHLLMLAFVLLAAVAGTLAAGLPALAAQQGRALPLLFPLATAVIGLLVGLIFPLASRAHATRGLSRAAAALYAADLVGAAGGAVLAGALFAPVLGLPSTCGLASVICGAGAVLVATWTAFTRSSRG